MLLQPRKARFESGLLVRNQDSGQGALSWTVLGLFEVRTSSRA